MSRDDQILPVRPTTSANTAISNSSSLLTNVRRFNPLSSYSSYTYGLSFYIVTPEFHNEFVSRGIFLKDSPGYYIVAQSGGIKELEPRAITDSGKLDSPVNNSGLDFYIEDLAINSLLATGSSPIVRTSVEFKIIESLGFTFLTRLAKTVEELNKKSVLLSQSGGKPNLYQHHYVIGIKFHGYDENGNLVTQSSNSNNSLETCERFFSIIISNITYKLDGRATTYTVTAVPSGQSAAQGLKRGMVKKTTTINATTVGEAIGNSEKSNRSSKKSLIQILNDTQFEEKDSKRRKLVNKYSVEWLGKEILNSNLVSNDTFDLATINQSSVKNTRDSNVRTSSKATSYDPNTRTLTIDQGTSAISVIDNIIAKSTYVTKKLLEQNNAQLQTATKTLSLSTELQWYSINTIAKPLDYDTEVNDWVYDIVYQIQPYSIPYLRSLYKDKTSKYYGPVKEYDYFLTGQNTEIINYEVKYDSQFFVIRSITNSSDGNANVEGIDSSVSISPQPASPTSVNLSGYNNVSGIAENVKANVNNIVDQATATLRITGDPDLLMPCVSNHPSLTPEYFQKLYGPDGYSINPYGGQIFIEIKFNLAEDYTDQGVLDVSNSIRFYESHANARKMGINGIVYRITEVKNSFRSGKFEQELDCLIASETELGIKDMDNKDSKREERYTPAGRAFTTAVAAARSSQAASKTSNKLLYPTSNKNDDQWLTQGRLPPVVESRSTPIPTLTQIRFRFR